MSDTEARQGEHSRGGRGKGVALPGLKDARIDLGYSLRELEARSGVHAASISKLELQHNGAQPRTARKLADALGVEVRDLRREPSAGREGE